MRVKAFTLVEMLVVLGIISLLLLLFVPNLSQQKATIQKKSNAAIIKVVESQMALYELEHGKEATVEELQRGGYITKTQAEKYAEAKQ